MVGPARTGAASGGVTNVGPHQEKHFRVNELVTLWGLSRNTIIRAFANEPDVLRIQSSTQTTGKRKLTMLSIPESVALRVHERLSKGLGNNGLQPATTRRNPLRVIRLRDLHTGMTKQPRNVADTEAA